jgi:hypothetical protein
MRWEAPLAWFEAPACLPTAPCSFVFALCVCFSLSLLPVLAPNDIYASRHRTICSIFLHYISLQTPIDPLDYMALPANPQACQQRQSAD